MRRKPYGTFRVQGLVHTDDGIHDGPQLALDVRPVCMQLRAQTGCRLTCSRTDTPAPIGITWISASAFIVSPLSVGRRSPFRAAYRCAALALETYHPIDRSAASQPSDLLGMLGRSP